MVAAVRESLKWPILMRDIACDGTDVVVGIVDAALDVGHPALRDAILTVWHQGATAGGTAHPSGVGRVFGGDQISELESAIGFPSLPGPRNHGTDVGAIAAGRGSPIGFATGATVVAVIVNGGHSEAVSGVEWIFKVATGMRLPAVVNISLGGDHFEPHDGSDLYSQALDSLTGPGRLVVAAAGNEGHLALHAAINLTSNQPQTVPVACGPYGGRDVKVFIASQTSETLRVRLKRWPLKSRSDVFIPWIEPGFEEGRSDEGWSAHVRVGDGRTSGEASCVIRREPGSSINYSFWWLEVESPDSSGLVNLWSQSAAAEFLSFDQLNEQGISPEHESVQHGHMIAFPASAFTVIAVGGCKELDGGGHGLCHFSNAGPTVDGRPKPELVMKAEGVRAVSPSELTGTSFAAPMVTGALAVALQVRPTLDPVAARDFLAAASVPLLDSGASSDGGGFGTLDAVQLERALQGLLVEEWQAPT